MENNETKLTVSGTMELSEEDVKKLKNSLREEILSDIKNNGLYKEDILNYLYSVSETDFIEIFKSVTSYFAYEQNALLITKAIHGIFAIHNTTISS